EAVFDSENAMIQCVKNYEKALQQPEKEEALQSAMMQMDDLKAWDFEANIKEILSKLNINNLDQQVYTLSGGQKKRLALAKLLIEDPEFVILDEPTNHLDLEMIEWLEKYLQHSRLTIFMVTHDRYFLERVCDTIIELDGGVLYRYKGNYSEFLEKKFLREEVQSRTMDRDKKMFERELQWVRRQPKARGTKAKARVDGFLDLKDKTTQKIDRTKLQIEIKGNRLGSKILEAHYINKSFDDLKIVENFHYKFSKKERVGIVGPNGVGKTTFLKMLTKQIRPDSGKVVVGDTIVFGYYTQAGMELKEDKRVIDVVQDIAEYIPLEKGMKISAAQMLERFMFNRKHQQVYVSQLSGGERRRLYLLTVLMANPNFLILDEPTNDLDIITLNVLEDFLQDFPGCVIIVTHDRYFMDKLVDHLFIFEGDGKIRDYNGNYTDYREEYKAKEHEDRKQDRSKQKQEEKGKVAVESKKEETPRLTYQERKELGKLEKEIEKLELKKATIIEKFNDANLAPQEIEKLSIELGAIKDKIEEKELRWMELSELA
ncbi:MAG: ABC-F family ATP-binding cassette domain-containing protein, partial [Saprospiraceae bacterium]